MKDYSAMSDFEINKQVAITLGLMVQEKDDSKVTGMTSSYHLQRPNTCWVTDELQPWYQYAPCNNAEDAWPIIVENKINIDHRESIKSGAMASQSGRKEIYAVDKNPLRAAMIVFLMMKDGAVNAQGETV